MANLRLLSILALVGLLGVVLLPPGCASSTSAPKERTDHTAACPGGAPACDGGEEDDTSGLLSLRQRQEKIASAADFEVCYISTQYVKECDTMTEDKCGDCVWDGTVNAHVCPAKHSCKELCQTPQIGATGKKDGSDPSCEPGDGSGWPEYFEACKAWAYQLEKDGVAWTKPYDMELYVNMSKVGSAGLNRMCLGAGSISFPKTKFPCAIHQSADMYTCSSDGPYVTGGKAQFEAIRDVFEKKMAECGANMWNKEYCVVDAEGIEENGPVQLGISIGHGNLNGVCGTVSLMKYAAPTGFKQVDCDASGGTCSNHPTGDKRLAPTGFNNSSPRYMINVQAGMRSWSGEYKSYGYLAPDNSHGNACDVPHVKVVEWKTAQAWLSKQTYKVTCGTKGCSKTA